MGRRAAAVAGALAIAAGAGAGCSSDGDGGPVGPLTVSDGWVAQGEEVAAVYLHVDNEGADDRMVGASMADAASVTVMGESGGGVGSHEGAGEEIDIEVPTGTTTFRPGERHIMLNDLSRPLEPGDRFELTLEFGRNGSRTAAVEVLSWDQAVERIESAAP